MNKAIMDNIDEAIQDTYDLSGTRASSISEARRLNLGGDIDSPTSRSEDNSQSPEEIPEDAINPSHYRKHPSGIECIEVVRHMNFNTGNAMKYIWRYLDKGDPVENLKKAQWYLDDEIRRLEGQR